jgi:hypothetical protein
MQETDYKKKGGFFPRQSPSTPSTQATRWRSQARTDGLAVGERAPPAGARGAPHEEPAERATNPARSAGEFLNEIKSSTSHQCAIHRIPADAGRVSLV